MIVPNLCCMTAIKQRKVKTTLLDMIQAKLMVNRTFLFGAAKGMKAPEVFMATIKAYALQEPLLRHV